MTDLSNSSWRVNAACMARASCSQSLVEPSMSVNRNVRVPIGGLTTTQSSSLLPLKGHYSSGTFLGFFVRQVPGDDCAAHFESLRRHRGRPRAGHRLTGCSMGCSTWSPETSGHSLYHLRFTCKSALSESRRADSNRLPLLQLRVCGQWLPKIAQECKSRISKQFLVPSIAHYCRALRPG